MKRIIQKHPVASKILVSFLLIFAGFIYSKYEYITIVLFIVFLGLFCLICFLTPKKNYNGPNCKTDRKLFDLEANKDFRNLRICYICYKISKNLPFILLASVLIYLISNGINIKRLTGTKTIELTLLVTSTICFIYFLVDSILGIVKGKMFTANTNLDNFISKKKKAEINELDTAVEQRLTQLTKANQEFNGKVSKVAEVTAITGVISTVSETLINEFSYLDKVWLLLSIFMLAFAIIDIIKMLLEYEDIVYVYKKLDVILDKAKANKK